MELDTIVEILHQKLGRFQIQTFSLLLIPFVCHAFFYLSYVFTAMKSPHMRCLVPECEGSDSGPDGSWLAFAVPFTEQGVPEPCLRFSTSSAASSGASVAASSAASEPLSCAPTAFSNATMACERRVYPNPHLSILTEWDVACSADSAWLASAVGLANNLGRLAGQPLSGYVSDNLGRRTAILLGLGGAVVVGLSRSFAPSYAFFVAFEFLDPIFHDGLSAAGFLLGVELLPAAHRGPWSAVSHMVFPLGLVYLGVVAWLLPFWRTLLRVMYGSALLALPALWVLPESFRWLMSRGRTADAVATIKRVAKMNGIRPELLKLDQLQTAEVQLAEKETRTELRSTFLREFVRFAKSRVLLFRFFNCCLCWIVNMLVYDGLSVNSVSMAGNQYLNFILVELVEVPGGLVAWLAMRLAGRRRVLSASLAATAVCCLSYHFLPTPGDGGAPWLRVAAVLVAKLSITVSFTVVYVVTAELFPTRTRHTLCALSSTAGRLGTILAPQTRLLIAYLDSLPFIVFGCATLVTGLSSLALPETSSSRLPDSVQEAEQLGRAGRAEAEVKGRGAPSV